MAKINIKFNNKTYSIDSASLADATARLEARLMDMMEERLEGDGAEFYTLAPTALSFRSTAPLNELQEIQINGVTVDPANYTLEEGSTIVTFPIDYLKTLNVGSYEVAVASDSKTVKGDFSVKAPELNEYGFYYNQPYTANMPMFGGDTAFFVREDGTYDIITVGKNPDTGSYTIEGNNIVATHPILGTLTCTISADGTSIYCNQVATNFTLNGSIAIAADDDYIYEYKEDLGGYEVTVIDKTKTEYGAIKTGINGIDTVKLADYMFITNYNLIVAPIIPDSVIGIGEEAFYDAKNLESVILGNGVTIIGADAFGDCPNLKNVTFGNNIQTIGVQAFGGCLSIANIAIPDSAIAIEGGAFYNCSSLTSVVIGSGVTYIGDYAFDGCTSLEDIVYKGTAEQWMDITKDELWNNGVPATHVHCIDGDVAL